MSLKSKSLKTEQWQLVLPDVLHSIRYLLCTANNETPHERFMNFSRRSSTASSIPSWSAEPGPVYGKPHVRHSKFDILVEKVDVLQANPHYAHIRYPDGRETTVSTKHLAPYGYVEHVETPTSTQVPTAETKAPGPLPQDNSHHADIDNIRSRIASTLQSASLTDCNLTKDKLPARIETAKKRQGHSRTSR